MLANLFYRNPRLTALAVILVLVAGTGAFISLARQEDPALARRFATITTFFPGANALRVESLVTEKIEAELLELHEIVEIDSRSNSGVSLIVVELDEIFGEDEVDGVWSKVRDKLRDAEALLPAGATAPDLVDQTTTAVTLLVGLLSTRGEPQLDILGRLAEELETQLRNLPGTKETEIFGEPEEEIRVEVDPVLLASLGLSAAEIASVLGRADAKVPAGELRHERNDLLLEVAGELDSLERIRRVPLREDPEGRLLRVGDIAGVTKTVREPPRSLAILDGRRGVAVGATMQPDRRVDRWAEAARAALDAFERELPGNVELVVLFDQSYYTETRLRTLAGNLLLGAGLVVLVLFLLMGYRLALIVASALPLTVAAVLAEMNLIGMPLHQTSVTGLIIALGLLIDNAIVVVDEYDGLARSGLAPGVAVARAVRHLAVPLFASTLTTILAFLPIVLMAGGGGEFVGPIAIGVGLSVGSSYLLSLTVIPALAGYVSRPDPHAPQRWWRDGWNSSALTAVYRRSLDLVLARPMLGVAVSLVLPLAGFLASRSLVEQFFPPNDRNQFQIQLLLPPQTALAETTATVARARELVNAEPDVVASDWFVGESPPRVFYNMLGSEDRVSSFAGGYVTTVSPGATERLLPRLQRELIAAFPEALAIALPFEQGPPFDAPIEIRIVGPDLDTLRTLGESLRSVLAVTDRVTYTRAQVTGGEPKLMVRADEFETRLAGLGLVDIADQLQGKLEGVGGGSVIEATEEIPIRVRVGAGPRGDLAQIASDYLHPTQRNGAPRVDQIAGVSLGALAEIDLVPQLAGITRRNGQRSNTVQAYLEPYALISESLEDFERRLAETGFELPPGYRMETGGEDEERSEALGSMASFALPLLVLMGGTIILSFNSFRMGAIIGCVAFLSIGLALLGVWLFGYPLGFLAIVGTMGLIGLAINGGIVVLSALRADPGALSGDPDAVREVVVGATRHIVATTLTTIGGFIPLIVLGGRFWPPLATAIAGGVGGSAILSLYLVPSLFIRSTRRGSARSGASGQARDSRDRTGKD